MPALEMNVVKMFQPKITTQLRCNNCGITGASYCNCDAGYSVVKPKDAVDKYDKAYPNQPIKKVTEAVGVGHASVSRARAARRATEPKVQNGPLHNSKVQLSDGRIFPMTKKYTKTIEAKTTEQMLARKLESYVTIQVTLLDRARLDKKINNKHKPELIEILKCSADKLMSLAQALDDR